MDSQLVSDPKRYLQLVLRSKLVDRAAIRTIVDDFRAEVGEDPRDSRQLAKRMIDKGLLTEWQNWHLLKGRSKGFYIGKYKLTGYLGSGGMSRVYSAEHVLLGRPVAVKVFTQQSGQDAFRLKRFYRESQAIASLCHPNIVRVHDFDSQAPFHFLVMERIFGTDLHKLVQQQGPLEYLTAAEYMTQAAKGLNHAHTAQMIHRDIKPGNLMVDKQGCVKILDLGVVKLKGDSNYSITVEQGVNIIGTVDYLPPEQFYDGHEVDERADLYSLGCTLYYLLTGRPPFNRGNQIQRIMMHQTQEPEPIQQFRPDVPPGLTEICRRLMAKKPDDRYTSAAQAAQVLATWMHGYAADLDTRRPVELAETLPFSTSGATLHEKSSEKPIREVARRLRQSMETLLSNARTGYHSQLHLLLDGFSFTAHEQAHQRLIPADEYSVEFRRQKKRLLSTLTEMAKFSRVTVSIETKPVGEQTAYYVSFVPTAAPHEFRQEGPFVHLENAFRLIPEQRNAA